MEPVEPFFKYWAIGMLSLFIGCTILTIIDRYEYLKLMILKKSIFKLYDFCLENADKSILFYNDEYLSHFILGDYNIYCWHKDKKATIFDCSVESKDEDRVFDFHYKKLNNILYNRYINENRKRKISKTEQGLVYE